jgi:hypothetical protein
MRCSGVMTKVSQPACSRSSPMELCTTYVELASTSNFFHQSQQVLESHGSSKRLLVSAMAQKDEPTELYG